jgi:hypothetical protein
VAPVVDKEVFDLEGVIFKEVIHMRGVVHERIEREKGEQEEEKDFEDFPIEEFFPETHYSTPWEKRLRERSESQRIKG